MSERPKFFDDLAGVAGGAISALAGLRDETEAIIRARVDETIRKLELVRREAGDAGKGASRRKPIGFLRSRAGIAAVRI
jgi:BMFP domain-containing protein YqiC